MTTFDVRWIDIEPWLLASSQPTYIMARARAHDQPKAWAGNTEVACLGDYWVPNSSVFEENPVWSVTRTGDVVKIPVFAYKVQRAMASVWGLGLQIGMAAIADLRHHVSEVPLSVTLVLSNTCTDLSPAEEFFRCYVGIAVRTK